MNISVNNKKMSFKVFTDLVGKHFAHLPAKQKDEALKDHYEKATGRKAKSTGSKKRKL
jgi:hypothetical protein